MKRFLLKIEDFIYQKIIKKGLALSKLGRASISGKADTGLNFDHMYKRQPQGLSPVGKFIDKVLLNLPSVKATRHRKDIIIKILQNEIENNIVLDKKTKVLDLASGPARYLVELISEHNQDNIEILCLDADRSSLNFGKMLIGRKPVRYTKANIFSLNHLKKLSKKVKWIPNIVISSGFFVYLEDDKVISILQDIHRHVDNDSLLIFTSQVDNPSKKLMEKLGKASSGKPWALYYRKPDQLRKWMLDIGFRDVIISVDQWGMYEFCTGRKHLYEQK
ncbi:MAG: class I SAM-dependent methyltransferase family protein [Candidatus Omnitrophica bacterium]|nr:class I SAM-dependent methyltransferase family protein [Candidatus Omnitrophota bacterium]